MRSISEVSGKAIHIDDFVKEIERRKKKGVFTTEFKVSCHTVYAKGSCDYRCTVCGFTGQSNSSCWFKHFPQRHLAFEVMSSGSPTAQTVSQSVSDCCGLKYKQRFLSVYHWICE